jgi:SAM-dependent methyltransferase
MSSFEDEWRARFERFARKHTDEASVSGWSATGLRRRIRYFRSLVPAAPDGSVPVALELGCGAGTYVRLLAALGYRAIGLDYSLTTLGRARSAERGGTGRYVAGEAYRLPCRARSVDVVVCIGVLQALAHPEAAVAEIARVLRPGGKLLLEALNRRSLAARVGRIEARLRRLPPRVLAYDPAEVSEWLARAGLEVEARVAICLPPRRLAGIERVLDAPVLQQAVAASPVLSGLLAHAVWFQCRRRLAEARCA